MNKMNYFWLICFSCLSLVFIACDDDSPVIPAEDDERGLILINQGNFTPGNGTIDLYHPETNEMEQGVYRRVNGEAVGGSIESASIAGDDMVIIVNQFGGPGKVIFARPATLEREHEESSEANLYSPRYAAYTSSHIFVSVWGAAEADWSLRNSSVAVFNRSTHQLEKNIAVPSGAEGVLADGANLWVANSYTDTITIINTGTLEIDRKFKSVRGTSSIEKGPNGKIWTLAGDTISRYNSSTFALETKIKLPGSASKWQFIENNLYFLTQAYSADWSITYNKLYRLNVSQEGAQPEQVLEMDDAQLFWVDPQTSEIYLGVAAGADPGTLLRLSSDGTELDRKPAGVFPQQFLLR